MFGTTTAPGNYGRHDRGHTDSAHAPHATSPIAQLEDNDVVKHEIVQVIITWLLKQGYTASAQLLREEATVKLRTDHHQRKAVRAICRCVEEQNWDGAQKAMKKLDTSNPDTLSAGITHFASLSRSLPFMLAQQQFLELVDDDSGQKAFTFFVRSIKPFEAVIGREHFHKLSYLLTCKSVAEAELQYPEFRSWTPETGRSQLLFYIRRMMDGNCIDQYCKPGNLMDSDGVGGTSPLPTLEAMLSKALSFDIVLEKMPFIAKDFQRASIGSLGAPLYKQLPPVHPLCTIDVNSIVRASLPSLLPRTGAASAGIGSSAGAAASPGPSSAMGGGTSSATHTLMGLGLESAAPPPLPGGGRLRVSCCQPFFSASAIAVGTFQGAVLYITYPDARCVSSSSFSTERAQLLYQHTHPIKGMRRCGGKLLCWGGSQALVLNLSQLIESPLAAEDAESAVAECVLNVFTHTADVYCGAFFPCGSIILSGLSVGTVTVWDAKNGTKMMENTFSPSSVISAAVNRLGSVYYAAFKDGVIRAVDTTTGLQVFSFSSSIALELSSISLSPSSCLLLASYRGGTIRLWDTITGNLLPIRFAGIENNTRTSVPVCFGQSDGFIFSGSEDGNLFFWNLAKDPNQVEAQTKRPLYSQQAIENHSMFENASRWPRGEIKHPHTQLSLHQACVTDIKSEDKYEVSCSDDGIIAVCVSSI